MQILIFLSLLYKLVSDPNLDPLSAQTIKCSEELKKKFRFPFFLKQYNEKSALDFRGNKLL